MHEVCDEEPRGHLTQIVKLVCVPERRAAKKDNDLAFADAMVSLYVPFEVIGSGTRIQLSGESFARQR